MTAVAAPPRPWAPPRHERLSVFMRGLELEAEIGVHPHERGRVQPLRVDVEAELAPGPVTGMSDTLNYETLRALALALADRGHIELVESYADDLAAAVLRNTAALRVRVRVEKPEALAGAQAAGVEVWLSRG